MHGNILRYGRMGFERSETGKQALERRRSIGTNKYTCIPTFLIRLVMKGIIKWHSVKQNDYDHYGQFIDFWNVTSNSVAQNLQLNKFCIYFCSTCRHSYISPFYMQVVHPLISSHFTRLFVRLYSFFEQILLRIPHR